MEDLARFSRRFALPLLAGGRVACSPALGVRAAPALGLPALDSEVGHSLHHALRSRAAPVHPLPAGETSAAVLELLVAAHDLLSTAHPDTGNLLGGTARLLRRHAEILTARNHPDALPEALARHAVVDAACRAAREDQRVTWWTGSAEFHGTTAPTRLLALPALRRVRTENVRVPLVRAGLGTGSASVRNARRSLLYAMFLASPISPLLLCMEGTVPLPLDLRQPRGKGENTFATLRFADHPPLITLLCDRALAAGFWGPVQAFTSAVNLLLTTESAPPWAVARALRIVAALHERRLFSAWLVRQKSTGSENRKDLLPDESAAWPQVRSALALWRAARVVGGGLGWAPLPDELRPLLDEVEQKVRGTPFLESSAGYVRAAETRLAA